jgi:hypothetical protein
MAPAVTVKPERTSKMVPASAMPHQSEIAGLGTTDPKATDAFRIEEIVRRAHRIHREHGGLFGYDFEDWVQAWRAIPQIASETQMEQVNEHNSEFVPGERTEILEPCFGCGN